MKEQIIHDMPVGKYRSDPAIGSSQVKSLREIQMYLYREEHPIIETPDMHRGTLAHAALLENLSREQLAERHPIEKRAGWKEEDHDKAFAIAEAARNHPLIGRILKIGRPEVSAFAELGGLKVKGRFDWYQDFDDDRKIMRVRGGVPFHVDASAISIYDFKTLGKGFAEIDKFMGYVGNNDLHIQAAFYHDIAAKLLGHPPARFSWIVIEREPPYMAAVYSAADWLELGRFEYERALQHYRDYLRLNADRRKSINHAGYHEDERILPVPAWRRKDRDGY